jgi:predicted RNA-binding protein with PIN domain
VAVTDQDRDTSELDRFFRPVLDVAVVVARDLVAEDGPAAVPARIRPFATVARLPKAGLTAARLALEEDSGFREAVASRIDESQVGRGPWLWATRPDDWRDLLEVEWELWQDARRDEAAAAAERSMEALLEKADASIQRLEARVAQLEQIVAVTEGDLARARVDHTDAAAQRDAALVELEVRTEERAEAVRQLKQTEERLAARTAELREAESLLTEAADDVAVAEEVAVGEDVVAAVRHTAGQVDALVRAVAQLSELVGARVEVADVAEVAGGAEPRRRRPHKVGRGIPEDSTTAAEVLLSLPRSVVLVDGYNVTMTAWPALAASDQRRILERTAGSVAARTGAEIHLVFDGDGDGAAVARSVPSGVRVRFTRAEVEADDEILDSIASFPLDRPVVVVSDDRRVRRGARARGANVVGSRQFQPLLLR